MSMYFALGFGCFIGVGIGFRVGVQSMSDRADKEYLRGYKEALKWSSAQLGLKERS